MTKVEFIAREFLERGGKKLRPRLCKAVYSSLGGTADISKICEAIECFHKASLIHDDIQDCDEERYGKPSIWKEHGIAMAIAAGDWLVAHGYDLIAQSGFEKVPEMLIVSSRSHKRLAEGQGDDLVYLGKYPSVEERVSVYERKTGEAFALAAQLGALAADRDAQTVVTMHDGLVFDVEGLLLTRLQILQIDELLRRSAGGEQAHHKAQNPKFVLHGFHYFYCFYSSVSGVVSG
jgi:geranylgeranyl pyrophosphate synthase